MNKIGIYMILNIQNNKMYIGSSKKLNRRKYEHFYSLQNNKHKNIHLQQSYNKYGKQSFSFIILEKLEDSSNLLEKELDWISKKNTNNPNFGYNQVLPNKNGSYIFTENVKEKLRRIRYTQLFGNLKEEEYLNILRNKDLFKHRERKDFKKPIIQLSKNGEFIQEHSSVVSTAKFFNTKEELVGRVLRGKQKTLKGYLLIAKEDYNENINYSIIPKVSYLKKGYQPGKEVLLYNLETLEVIEEFATIKELCLKKSWNQKAVYKVTCGERKSYKGFGIKFK